MTRLRQNLTSNGSKFKVSLIPLKVKKIEDKENKLFYNKY